MKKIQELIKKLRQTDNPKEQDKIKMQIDALEQQQEFNKKHSRP